MDTHTHTHTHTHTCLHQAALKIDRQTDKHTCSSSPLFPLLPQGHSVCDLDVFDKDQYYVITPLLFATAKGHQQCVQILIDAGADVNGLATGLSRTPLLIASQEGHEGCVEVLLKHGADPNLPCNISFPQLPIHAAAENGHSSILARLIAVTGRV
uniref:Uncharacterized protein n=1 Tax=Hucho hucho TaxID=62062 RepID=A0A4W5PSF3_9TELE